LRNIIDQTPQAFTPECRRTIRCTGAAKSTRIERDVVRRRPVIGDDYEVLDLQVTVATVFDIFLSLHFLFAF